MSVHGPAQIERARRSGETPTEELLRRAGVVYGDRRYEDTLQAHFRDKAATDIIQIVYPRRDGAARITSR